MNSRGDDREERLVQGRELPALFPALGVVVEEIGPQRVVVRMDVPEHQRAAGRTVERGYDVDRHAQHVVHTAVRSQRSAPA